MKNLRIAHPRIHHTSPPGRLVTGAVVTADYTTELHKKIETRKQGGRSRTIIAASTESPSIELDLGALPAASEVYQISPDPSDYVLVSLPIVTVEIPNRNLQGFSLAEMGYFDPHQGKMVYQTFGQKGTYLDHNNDAPHKARGIIADVGMSYIPKYDVWKINAVTLWDRTKDTKLVNEILDKKRTGYSMGALVVAFVCSICGTMDDKCAHMQNKGALYGDDKRLAWQVCTGVTFFEISSVISPADSTSVSEDIFL